MIESAGGPGAGATSRSGPDGPPPAPGPRPSALVDVFVDRVRAVGGSATVSSPARLVETLRGIVADDGLVLLTPELASLADGLREAGVDAWVAARPALTAAGDPRVASAQVAASSVGGLDLESALRTAGAGVTGSVVAVAASGSVGVGPGGGGGGLLAALPPHHVVLLSVDDLRATMADALLVVESRFDELGGELVFVTGPSRTADIEMLSVIGVHGPLRFDVVLIEAPGEAAAEPGGGSSGGPVELPLKGSEHGGP